MKYISCEADGVTEWFEETDDRPPWQLTPEGLLDLVHLGHWVYISPGRISDRSKADSLQKGLILLQLSWMLTSCVARKWYGLPLTLLEVHTMVHVVCAFVMYAFWFNKPVDVRVPEVLEDTEERCNAMAHLCHVSLHPREKLHFLSRNNLEDAPVCKCGAADTVYRSQDPNETYDPKKPRLQHRRWHAAVEAVRAVDQFRDCIAPHETFEDFRSSNMLFSNFISGINHSSSYRAESLGIASGISIIPILYGGIHLAAWSSEFPSTMESILWRVSSISIMLTMLIWPCVAVIWEGGPGNDSVNRFRDAEFVDGADGTRNLVKWLITRPVTYTIWVVLTGVLLASVLGRFYLVVESFISLRAVPVGAYWVPLWLKYIPHV